MSIVTDRTVLKQISEECHDVVEIRSIVEKLRVELDGVGNGLGLAAIQIGIPKRVALIRYSGNDDGNLVLINPKILEKHVPFVYFREGCLSIPGHYLNTERYQDILVANQYIDGNELKERKFVAFYSKDGEFRYSQDKDSNLLCVCIQHEVDHFDGKLIDECEVKNEPIVKQSKVGRNDPCLCGKKDASGKAVKYKKCCGK